MKHTRLPWEIEIGENDIQTNVCGPIKTVYRRTRNVPEDVIQANMAAMEQEAMANAELIVAAPTAPHECDPECPGEQNRRKLAVYGELLAALPDPQKLRNLVKWLNTDEAGLTWLRL